MEKVNIFDQISKNKRNSMLLVVIVFSVLFGLVYLISAIFAPELSFFMLILAFPMIFLYTYASYRYGDKIVLSATGAKPVENDARHIHLINAVDGLSIAAGIPKPKIYVIENDEINAYATGRDTEHASIAVTTGTLKKLDRDELEGVIGHEISHIKNFDIRFAMIVAVMVGIIAIISDMFLRSWRYRKKDDRESDKGGLLILIGFILAIVAPIVVRLVQLAISRRREYLADASSAQLTRYPDGLADALEKIKKYNEGRMRVSEAVSHLFFTDPNKSPLDSLFATHPSIESRIKLLRCM